MKLVAMVCAVGVSAAASPAAAPAAFPGENGRLVLALTGGCGVDERYLATMPWRGGELTPITDPCPTVTHGDDYGVFAPDASPSGRMVVAEQSGSEDHTGRYYALLTMASDGSEGRSVQKEGLTEDASPPSFAPDGLHIAIHGGNSIWSVPIDGSEPRMIHRGPPCAGESTSQTCTILTNPRWSPDGKLIAVTAKVYHAYEGGTPPIRKGIWLMRADDGTLVRRVSKGGDWVDWSPDGKQLVFGSKYDVDVGRDRAAGGNLYVVDRDGSDRRTLVYRKGIVDTEPTWSPNGRWIAFLSTDSVRLSLWRIRASGGKPHRVQRLPPAASDVNEGDLEPGLAWLPRPHTEPSSGGQAG